MGPFLEHKGWDTLVDAVERLGDPKAVAMAINTVPPGKNPGLTGKYWLALLKISAGDMEHFKAMAKSWKLNASSEQFANELDELVKHLETAKLIGQAIACGEGSNLRRPLALSGLARALGFCDALLPEPLSDTTFDLSPYPPQLHEALLQLARFDPARQQRRRQDFAQGLSLSPSISTSELSTLVEKIEKGQSRAQTGP